MVRRGFFSFHYGRDVWRVNQVRNSWVTSNDREAAGFFDAAEQEEIKRATDEKIRKWINEQLHGTSVTVILIGNETAERDWVHYEIKKSIERGNGIVGVKIHSLKNKEGSTDFSGTNPLKKFVVEDGDQVRTLSSIFPTYDWKRENGRENIGEWVEEAAETADSLSHEQQNTVRRRESIREGVNPDAGAVILLLIIIAILIDEYTDINLRDMIDVSKLQQHSHQSDQFSDHEF